MSTRFNRVSIIGLGYIGLPTAAVIASRDIRVIGVDISKNVVDTINAGSVHIVEPDLDMLVHAAVKSEKLKAVTEPEPSDVFIIAVPTPFKGKNHEPDISYIESAVRSIAPVLAKGNLVILESTSPVGTTEEMARWIAEERKDLKVAGSTDETPDVYVAYCPERVLPGRVIQELIDNDRIIGGITRSCAEHASDLYKIFVKGNCLITSSRTAELVKLTENAFRDVNIAFANELSIISDKLGINVWDLISLANKHPRVNILQPGPGVGGHCIAVDPWFIVDSAPDQARLIRTAREVNDSKPEWLIAKVRAAADSNPNAKIACLGLSFKPDIDDLRESPALDITRKLAADYPGRVIAVEPNISEMPAVLEGSVTLVDISEALRDAAIVVALVDHRQFKSISRNEVAEKILFDTRGLWDIRNAG